MILGDLVYDKINDLLCREMTLVAVMFGLDFVTNQIWVIASVHLVKNELPLSEFARPIKTSEGHEVESY